MEIEATIDLSVSIKVNVPDDVIKMGEDEVSDYPDLEAPRERVQIKLHPMSEEPKQGTEYFYEISESHILWRESMFMIKAYYGGWERYASNAKHKFKKIGWLYDHELSQLIKDNTAP